MPDAPLRTWHERDKQVLRLQLARPKANIIDSEMIDALAAALSGHAADERLMAVLIDAEGPHFSFGASVEEHLPDQCAAMLKKINALILQMLAYPVPIVAAVKGQCLGGALELACAANLIVAAPDTMLGQPEISLAVFAPAASCLLPERIGQAQAEMILLSGKSIDAARAKQIGLVDEVSDMPAEAALAWIDENLIGKSASSLRIALSAVRHDYVERMKVKFDAVEKMYLDVLMRTKDPVEGLTAFLEKRMPVWQNTTKGTDR